MPGTPSTSAVSEQLLPAVLLLSLAIAVAALPRRRRLPDGFHAASSTTRRPRGARVSPGAGV